MTRFPGLEERHGQILSWGVLRAITDWGLCLQERNIILAGTYEYRFPSPSAIRDATANTNNEQIEAKPEPIKATVDMTSRFIGLVVVPGQHITKIELEETPQQSRLRDTLRKS
jgi:hypothetical protein